MTTDPGATTVTATLLTLADALRLTGEDGDPLERAGAVMAHLPEVPPPPQYDIIDQRCTHSSHVDAARFYRMSGYCQNCGTEPLVGLFTAGERHGYEGGPCPACGCRKVRWRKLADADPGTAL